MFQIRLKNLIIISLLIFGIAAFSVVAYADDPSSGDPSESPEESLVLTQEQEQIVLESAQEILNILQSNELTSTRAVEYTTTDIYLLLLQILSNNNSSSAASLSTIQNYLLLIRNALTGNSATTQSIANTLYGKFGALLDLVTELTDGNADWTSNHTLGPLQYIAFAFDLHNFSNLTDFEQYTLYDYLILGDNILAGIQEYLPNLIPYDYTSILSTISSAIYSVVSNTSLISSRILNFSNAFDNYVRYADSFHWQSFINGSSPYFVGYTYDFEDIITLPSSGTLSLNQDFYAWFSGMPQDFYNNYLYKIHINVQRLALNNYVYTPTVEFYVRYNNASYKVNNIDFMVIPYRSGIDIYFTSPVFSTYDEFAIKFIAPPILAITNVDPIINFLRSDQRDYWDFKDQIIKYKNANTISDFKKLYASDDLIAAKENQQAFEDQALSDFTGSGSAAAKGSDLSSLKGISGSFTSGLSSGGTISQATSVFSSNSELWGWFTQNTKNSLDNSSQFLQNNSNLRLLSNNHDTSQEIVNMYELNKQGLLDWFH